MYTICSYTRTFACIRTVNQISRHCLYTRKYVRIQHVRIRAHRCVYKHKPFIVVCSLSTIATCIPSSETPSYVSFNANHRRFSIVWCPRLLSGGVLLGNEPFYMSSLCGTCWVSRAKKYGTSSHIRITNWMSAALSGGYGMKNMSWALPNCTESFPKSKHHLMKNAAKRGRVLGAHNNKQTFRVTALSNASVWLIAIRRIANDE